MRLLLFEDTHWADHHWKFWIYCVNLPSTYRRLSGGRNLSFNAAA
jgi:hypothetical protein